MKKKRIVIVLFQIESEFGGILNHIRNLAKGIEENGCEVKVLYCVYKALRDGKSAELDNIDIGLQVRITGKGTQGKLHATPDSLRSYRTPYDQRKLMEELATYDGVIIGWIPTTGEAKYWNTDWIDVLKHNKPMVYIVHDCHWLRYGKWAVSLRDRINCAIGVHPAAFYSLQNWPGRYACVLNPFDVSPALKDYPEKEEHWLCNTTFFKKWKHNDDGIRAAPFLRKVHLFESGGGIELRNMVADLKTQADYTGMYYDSYKHKLKQYWWKKGDVDVRKDWINNKIWDVACGSPNFHYLGLRKNTDIPKIQAACGASVEFAYHKKWGEHFNRAIIEGMIHHCLPFARPYGISDNANGIGHVFGPDNVILIPESAGPKRIAEIIEDGMTDKSLRKEMIKRNVTRVTSMFDRVNIGKHYLQLLFNETDDVGLFGVHEGEPDADVEKALLRFGVQRFPRTIRWPRLYRFPRSA